jgi:dihydrofolate synthase/folylpolyglutamate synthase
MTYRETLEYLYSQLPAFTRIGKAAYKANLDNIEQLCSALGNPERKFKSIHIAGTNGKGSTSHYLASILQEAGYKTGLFTSPHLKDFRERIKLNGKPISRQKVVKFTQQHTALFEELQPSFFEMSVALAFDYFAREQVDIAVIETGLGGRLDSTNVIIPELSLITNISFDHMDLLGDTLEQIASEKAGIIKQGIPVIVGEIQHETIEVFTSVSSNRKSPVVLAEHLVSWDSVAQKQKNGRLLLELEGKITGADLKTHPIKLSSQLPGIYQQKNLKTVLAGIQQLRMQGWKIPEEAVKLGIAQVVDNTGLHGRWEMISTHPRTMCDTGHNEAGISEVLLQLKSTKFERLHVVWGMVGDKDIRSVLSILPKNALYYFCQAAIPRSKNREELKQLGAEYGLIGKTYASVKRALAAAKNAADPDLDLIYIGGSTFVVAEVI